MQAWEMKPYVKLVCLFCYIVFFADSIFQLSKIYPFDVHWNEYDEYLFLIMQALERGYSINFHEPHTSWKFDPVELEK